MFLLTLEYINRSNTGYFCLWINYKKFIWTLRFADISREQMDYRDHQEKMELMVTLETLVSQETKVTPVITACQDVQDLEV